MFLPHRLFLFYKFVIRFQMPFLPYFLFAQDVLYYTHKDYLLFFPEIFASVAFILLFSKHVFGNLKPKQLNLILFYLVSSLFVCYLLLWNYTNTHTITYYFFFSLKHTHFILFIKLLLCFVFGLLLLFEWYTTFSHKRSNEYLFLTFLIFIAHLILISSNDFLVFYVALELSSLSTYILINERKHAITNTLNYFIISVLASIFLLFGIVYLYGLTGLLNFSQLELFFSLPLIEHTTYYTSLHLSIVFIVLGLCVKLGVAPFHFWILKVYANLTHHTFFVLSLLPKITFIYILYVVFNFSQFMAFSLSNLMLFLALACLIIGSLLALEQVMLKNILICSSIVNLGYMLINFYDYNYMNLIAYFMYLIVYILTMLTFFFTLYLAHMYYRRSSSIIYLYELNFLPVSLKVILSILILSLMGLPPFAGFFAKLFLLESLTANSKYGLVLLLQLFNVIGAYYYIYIILYSFFLTRPTESVSFDRENRLIELNNSGIMLFCLYICLLYICLFFVYYHSLITLLNDLLL